MDQCIAPPSIEKENGVRSFTADSCIGACRGGSCVLRDICIVRQAAAVNFLNIALHRRSSAQTGASK